MNDVERTVRLRELQHVLRQRLATELEAENEIVFVEVHELAELLDLQGSIPPSEDGTGQLLDVDVVLNMLEETRDYPANYQ